MYKFLLFVRTIRYLRVRQLVYFIIRRVLPFSRQISIQKYAPVLRKNVQIATTIPMPMMSNNENCFIFLNVSKTFDPEKIDWASMEMPKLWRYNLHYFDSVLEQDRSKENVEWLISDWISRNPQGRGDGWEPYTVSLRIVNWIQCFLQPEFSSKLNESWLRSLFLQTLWLEKNLEYHILANHYLKNAKALFFAGLFFDGPDAERWQKKGFDILLKEADEQFLSDGGHYERSLMYHVIVVEDYLDVLNLLLHSDHSVPPEAMDFLKFKSLTALNFLNDLCYPDGGIPLFNDAAFGIAPTPTEVFEYANSLMGYKRKTHSKAFSLSLKEQSGYYAMRHNDDMLLVDCGQIGPDYQPGHAHCDLLSYELVLNGQRVIVDSGVYNYETGKMRAYVRGTRAHNTVMVDKTEQSEIWGAFRVARRAKPIEGYLEKIEANTGRFVGAHDGYRRLSGQVVHQRVIDYDAAVGWTIQDQLQGGGIHFVESFIHVHPDFKAIIESGFIYLTNSQGRRVAHIRTMGTIEISIENGWYCPEFGIKIENDVVKLSAYREFPFSLCYQITKA